MHRISYDSSVTLFILHRSEKRQFRILFTRPGARRPRTQDVAVFSADKDAICCMPPLPRDPARRDGKRQCDYFVTVVHFRKVVIRQKVGSHLNGRPVI